MLNKYTLRFKVSLGLGLSLSFAVLVSGLLIYQVVERVMLQQAEESLYANVRNTEQMVRLMTSEGKTPDSLSQGMASLRKELKTARLLRTGYYYILDSEGLMVMHPSIEGEKVIDQVDLDGQPIFKTILAMKEGRLDYRWLNAETQKPQQKVAVCKKVESLNWTVCASINKSEIYEPIYIIRWVTVGCCLLLILISGPIGHYVAGKLQSFLLNISKRLLGAATSLASSSVLVNDSSKRIEENSTRQGAAVHETVSAVEEIKSMSERNSESSDASTAKVREAVSTANQGETAVNSLTQAIDEIVGGNDRIQKQVELTNQQLGNIVTVIREIDTKTKVINDIVFQTKLLAFNASVEAARAGEHGKGFAVVAEEVGNLAKMSGNAAHEISTMLTANVENVEKIIKQTQESVGRLILENRELVQKGSAQARVCGTTFSRMGSEVKNIEELSNNIAIASKEQAKGVEEISQSMVHLNSILSENERISRETSFAAEHLMSQNSILDELANELAWSILGDGIKNKLDPESKKAIEGGLKVHAEWKNRLIRVISGTSQEKLVPETVVQDDQCALGKWIYSSGQQKYRKSKQFEKLRQTHAEFHKVAASVLQAAQQNSGDHNKALIGINSAFDRASAIVIANLAALKFEE